MLLLQDLDSLGSLVWGRGQVSWKKLGLKILYGGRRPEIFKIMLFTQVKYIFDWVWGEGGRGPPNPMKNWVFSLDSVRDGVQTKNSIFHWVWGKLPRELS